MTPSILDLYILALIDRGAGSKYDLLKLGGVSLGSSSPAVKRLQLAKLVVQDDDGTDGRRPRHGLKLSPSGRRLVRKDWEVHLTSSSSEDLESILRLMDVAIHYGAAPAKIARFLEAAASYRLSMSRPVRTAANKAGEFSVMDMQKRWKSTRLLAEAKFLTQLAESTSPDKSTQRTKQSPTKTPRTWS